jgi:hypothetical protein
MQINTEDSSLRDVILETLINNGFSKDDCGTYFYKESIQMAVDRLMICSSDLEFNNFLLELLIPNSKFYSIIIEKIRYKMSIGNDCVFSFDENLNVRIFHECINRAFTRSNIVNINSNDQRLYMKLIFYFAQYVLRTESYSNTSNTVYARILSSKDN